MSVNLKERRELNHFLELLAFSSVKKFYPTAALKYSNVKSLESIYDHLLDCVEYGELNMLWEVKCTNDKQICARNIKEFENKNQALDKDLHCDICGYEFQVTQRDLFPFFEITDDFRDIVREDFKKKTNRLKISAF